MAATTRAARVTVGIPFYNAQKTLLDAIRSVFAQTLPDWELILVDDGSTDLGLDIARSVADPRVRVVSDGKNLGLAARLNQIAYLARGRYLARMDADDLMHPDRLTVQAEFLDRNPTVDVAGTGMFILDRSGSPVAKRLPRPDINPRAVLRGGAFMHATIMGRRNWFRANPYDAAFLRAQDFELWCRTFDHSRFANLSGCYYYCSEHAAFSLSKYAASATPHARAQWKHGVNHIGYLACFALCLEQFLKVPVYAGAVALRKHGRIVDRRSVRLSPREIAVVAADMARIRATALPMGTNRQMQAARGSDELL